LTFNRNILANYTSQLYVTAIGIVMVPVYIKLMGVEGYGLIGFYAMLQSWFSLLDMGLTPTIARETARFKGGTLNSVSYRTLVRALEGVFLTVALIGSLALFGAAYWFGDQWISSDTFTSKEIVTSLQLMAGVVGLRWLCGLYRGIIIGAEKLVLLSFFNIVVATLRFILIVPVLIYISTSPLTFFGFQIVISFVELGIIAWLAYSQLPTLPAGEKLEWKLKAVLPLLKFSFSVFFISSVWITVTQSDKLILSKILSLSDYGYFSVAVVAAGGIMVMTAPVTTATLPKMARMMAEGESDQVMSFYISVTRLISSIVLPIALLLGMFPGQVLWAWTGDHDLVARTAPVLSLYALGYGLLSVSALPYSLQYARGELKLHLIGSAIFVSVLLPLLVMGARAYGTEGAGWAWFATNLAYFLFWVPVLHRRFAPGIHLVWLIKYVAAPALSIAVSAVAMWEILPHTESRILTVAWLGVLAIALIGSSIGTNKLLSLWHKPSPSRGKNDRPPRV